MNYDEFRVWRDGLISQKPALRLDCMNPVKALGHLVRTEVPVSTPPSPAALLSRWQEVLGAGIDSERLVLGVGVRDLLRAMFDSLATKERTFWLPRDVYPVYWQIAKDHRLASFTTLPRLDMSFLTRTGAADCVLLPSPLSPTGRRLTSGESDTLIAWLNDSPHRCLMLDCVYNYSFPIGKDGHRELTKHPRCCSIYSMSKAWAQPQTAGCAIVSVAAKTDVQNRATTPNEIQRATAMERLTLEPNFPAKLQSRFKKQWLNLQPQIQRFDAKWQPPDTGYFSIIETPPHELWDEHHVVSVPASVFGSAANISIITCLFDIGTDDLENQ